MSVLKEYHFPAPFVRARYHQTRSARLTFVKNKGFFSAFWAIYYQRSSAARAERIFFRNLTQTGRAQNGKGISAAAFYAEPGI
jgi:hypothetical protein